LFEGQPAIDGKSVFKQRIPKQQDIDAAIGAVGGGIAGNGEGLIFGPRLHPRNGACLDLADDLVRDLLIKPRFGCLALLCVALAHVLVPRLKNRAACPGMGVGGDLRPSAAGPAQNPQARV
jgi:hypothetical protein